jgi:hypothetical protein
MLYAYSNSWSCRQEVGRLQLYGNDFKSALATFETLGQQQSEGDETAAKKMLVNHLITSFIRSLSN